MHKNKLSLFIVTVGLWCAQLNHSFNIGYDGNDAVVSYELSWGKERFEKEDYIKYFPYYKKYEETVHFVKVEGLDMSSLPHPYCDLQEVVHFYNFGMYFNSEFITKLFKHNTIVNALEIGSFYGLSTRHIASLLPKHGILYAVDSWAYWPGQYEQFLSNIIRAGLTDKIIPIKQASQDAIVMFRQLRLKYDLIYVDGDHETEGVLRDLEFYSPLLSAHGVICGDDWLLTTVRTAVVQFAQKHQLTICAGCNFWFLKDEGSYQIKSVLDANDATWIF